MLLLGDDVDGVLVELDATLLSVVDDPVVELVEPDVMLLSVGVVPVVVLLVEPEDMLLLAAVPALLVVAFVSEELPVELVPEVASARGEVDVVPQCSEIMRTSLTLNEFPLAEPVEEVGV